MQMKSPPALLRFHDRNSLPLGKSAQSSTFNAAGAEMRKSNPEVPLSGKIGQTFSFFQRSLQDDRQHRLPNKVDWFVGQKCCPCRFIQISAEKYAAQRLLRVQIPGRIDAAATLREANIHQNHIGIVFGR